jgi:hypothetical protein
VDEASGASDRRKKSIISRTPTSSGVGSIGTTVEILVSSLGGKGSLVPSSNYADHRLAGLWVHGIVEACDEKGRCAYYDPLRHAQ